MVHPPPQKSGPYRVRFSPAIWPLVGRMPSDGFRALQEVLERIATEADHTPAQGEGAKVSRRIAVDNQVLVYEQDDATRTVTLLELIRPAEAP
jgi:mRNA-degrading endonuclease RelE of RelBE toxin-antitoxin system